MPIERASEQCFPSKLVCQLIGLSSALAIKRKLSGCNCITGERVRGQHQVDHMADCCCLADADADAVAVSPVAQAIESIVQMHPARQTTRKLTHRLGDSHFLVHLSQFIIMCMRLTQNPSLNQMKSTQSAHCATIKTKLKLAVRLDAVCRAASVLATRAARLTGWISFGCKS